MSETLNYYITLPITELIAVLSSLAYVILAARGSLWCWPAALITTTLYTAIFYKVYLWSDSALQVYYFFMAIYGWINWKKHKNKTTGEQGRLPILTLPFLYHIKAIVILAGASWLLGLLMANYTPTHFPYLDATTTVFALFATYLVAQRVLENWLYWIVIDVVSIYLYQAKGLTPTAVLFALFVVLATYAYFNWSKLYKEEKQQPMKQSIT